LAIDDILTPEIFILGHIVRGSLTSYGINFLKQSAPTGIALRVPAEGAAHKIASSLQVYP